jgi:hypothetical protein
MQIGNLYIHFRFFVLQGTVRRSTDGDFIHANVDIDLIIGIRGFHEHLFI